MGMNLDGMKNEQSNNLNLTTQRFDELKTYMKTAEKDPEPGHDANLEFAIEAMLNRWKVQTGTKRDELKKLVSKIHAKLLLDPESRVIYRLLNVNMDNISTTVTP